MEVQEFIKKWNVAFEDKEQEMLFASQMEADLKSIQQVKPSVALEESSKTLTLINVDKEVVEICIEAYKNGEKLEAVKTLKQEIKKKYYTFGLKDAKDWLENECNP